MTPPVPKKLTDKHRKILSFLRDFQEKWQMPNTIREIGDAIGVPSTSQVNYYLSQLEMLGYITRTQKVARSIRLKTPDHPETSRRRAAEVPILGFIQAGLPITIPHSDLGLFDPESTIELPDSWVPSKTGCYALEVRGDSMRDALVDEGDLVILEPIEHAKNGEMVAAWLTPTEETTLKRYYLENNRVRLQPCNPAYQPIYANPDDVKIQGKVVFVFRRPNRYV